jgi:hypothetical protein
LRLLTQIHDLRWARDARRRRMVDFGVWLFESILDEKIEVVALIEHLAFDVRVMLSQEPHLSVLLRDQLLAHGGYFDVDIVFSKIEIRSEILGGFPVLVPFEGECVRFVLPVDAVEIKKTRELAFAVVSECNEFGR